MEEWATVKEHQASNITLLCDQHHKEVTNGLLPKSMVADANKDPINWKTGRSKPYSLHYSGREAEVSIGGAKCKQQDVGQGAYLWPLVIDGFPVVSVFLQDNHYLLNIFLFDKNNRLGISIVENQLVYNSGFYDVQLTGRKLTIRENYRQIIFDIRFDTPSTITFLRAYV
ncbi:MAG: cell division protein, partial [Bacteroidetes bacterium]